MKKIQYFEGLSAKHNVSMLAGQYDICLRDELGNVIVVNYNQLMTILELVDDNRYELSKEDALNESFEDRWTPWEEEVI